VHIFLGEIPTSADDYLTHENNVGTSCVLGSNPANTSCEKCKTDADKALIVTGAIPLTEALLSAISQGSLNSLDVADVEPYLAKNLHWRVTQVSL
jgi:tyrosinase